MRSFSKNLLLPLVGSGGDLRHTTLGGLILGFGFLWGCDPKMRSCCISLRLLLC